jgi:hypothetical protein
MRVGPGAAFKVRTPTATFMASPGLPRGRRGAAFKGRAPTAAFMTSPGLPRGRRGAAAALAAALACAWQAFLPAAGCVIANAEAGVCTPEADVAAAAPFCGSVVRYTACTPAQVRGYPANTIRMKDDWVSARYAQVVELRQHVEAGLWRFDDAGYANYTGGGGPPAQRFTGASADDCANAFRNVMCWLNFPRCDDSGASLAMCRSACENYFKACRYPLDMWRCYEPRFYGGSAAEGTQNDAILDRSGNPVYTRALLPGLPFVANGYDDAGAPLVLCTPSLKNGAPRTAAAGAALALTVAAAAAAVLAAAALQLQ